MCRKDLHGDDTTTQEFDHNIGETLNNLSTQTDASTGDINTTSSQPTSNNSENSHIQSRTNSAATQSNHDDDVD